MKKILMALILGAASVSAMAYQGTIAGDFKGWDGNSVYELADGHVIKQSEYAYDYCYAYRPDITIWQEGGQYKAKTSCDDEIVEVEVLK